MTGRAAPSVLVFDVNETLLDIEVLRPLFARLFGGDGASGLRTWFAQLVLYSQAVTLAGLHVPFSKLGAGALRMQGSIAGMTLAASDLAELDERMSGLPPHPEVADALSRLRDRGFRLVTLTNSAAQAGRDGVERAGLAEWFEQRFSVEAVGRFKPAPECYRLVADALGVPMGEICMVAAHVWDTLGAQAAGCAAALVTRPGNAVLPVEGLPQPDVSGPDLGTLAERIIARWRPLGPGPQPLAAQA